MAVLQFSYWLALRIAAIRDIDGVQQVATLFVEYASKKDVHSDNRLQCRLKTQRKKTKSAFYSLTTKFPIQLLHRVCCMLVTPFS